MRSRAFRRGVSMLAPIWPSGSVMRPIGRDDSEASPKSSVANGCPASRPASRRMPVPELPQSIGADGARQLHRLAVDAQVDRAVAGEFVEHLVRAPSACMALSVLRQSSLGRKLRMVQMPLDRPPRMAARWDMLLSPGTLNSAWSLEMAVTRNSDMSWGQNGLTGWVEQVALMFGGGQPLSSRFLAGVFQSGRGSRRGRRWFRAADLTAPRGFR